MVATTIKQRIIEYLKHHPDGINDDDLTDALGIRARQQANQRCRELEAEGLIIRRRINGKIHNFWAGLPITSEPKHKSPIETSSASNPWYWEGNVQAKIVGHLVSNGFLIRSVADTASRQRGIDVVAERDGYPMWVSVKGYPKGTSKTNPSLQASHWFKQAIFDVLEYRGQDAEVTIRVGLPDFPRYRSMAKKIAWLEPVANYSYIWVNDRGEVLE